MPNGSAGKQTVLVTAGASAPESVVQQCVEHLRERYAATIEHRSLHEEEVYFPLPRELRSFANTELTLRAAICAGPLRQTRWQRAVRLQRCTVSPAGALAPAVAMPACSAPIPRA